MKTITQFSKYGITSSNQFKCIVFWKFEQRQCQQQQQQMKKEIVELTMPIVLLCVVWNCITTNKMHDSMKI